jgi:hypothetical protein
VSAALNALVIVDPVAVETEDVAPVAEAVVEDVAEVAPDAAAVAVSAADTAEAVTKANKDGGRASRPSSSVQKAAKTSRPLVFRQGGPLKPDFGLSGYVHTSQTWPDCQTSLSPCLGD